MRKIVIAAAMAALCLSSAASVAENKSPEGARVYFINLQDGQTVKSPFKVQFGLSGMGVAPAGVEKENAGHHHLLINRPPLGKGEGGAQELENNLPADENHRHFGGGQTEVMLELPPGKHTLQLVLGDMNHIPHSPAVVSNVITITVE